MDAGPPIDAATAPPAGARVRAAAWDPATGRLTWRVHVALAAVGAVAWLYYSATEKVTSGGGLGWDGQRYGLWVWTLADDLRNGRVTDYHVRRIFPSALMWAWLRITGSEPLVTFVVRSFVAANAICVYLAGLFWLRACAALRLGGSRTLAGALLVGVTYATVKFPAYYPVLTDLFAFALGMAMLDCWLRGNLAGLVASVAASMFTWPSAGIVGAVLILFPRGARASLGRLSGAVPWAAGALAVAAGAAALYATVPGRPDVLPRLQRDGAFRAGGFGPLLALSIPLTMAYVYASARAVLGAFRGGAGAPRLTLPRPRLAAAAVLTVGGVEVAQRLLASGTYPLALTPIELFAGSAGLPAIFFVADVTYYGALAVLAALFLPAVLRAAAGLGVGAAAAVALGLAVNLYPEARMTLNVVPFLAVAVVLAAPLERISAPGWGFLVACQLAASKAWLHIGATAQEYEGDLARFPAQLLFMSQGPWMTTGTYLAHAAAASVALAVAAVLFLPPGRAAAGAPSSRR